MTISTLNTAAGDHLNAYTAQLGRKQAAGRADASRGTVQRGDSADSASFSDEARLLSTVGKAANSAPDVREDKVAALRIQVSNGTYRVSGRAVAQAMLESDASVFSE